MTDRTHHVIEREELLERGLGSAANLTFDQIVRAIKARDLFVEVCTNGVTLNEAKVVEQMILPDLVPIGELHPGRQRRIAEIFYRLDMSPSPEVPEGLFYQPVSPFDDLLTAEERAWLKAHPDIRFAFSGDFPPALIVREDGRLTGILKDMLDLFNQRL